MYKIIFISFIILVFGNFSRESLHASQNKDCFIKDIDEEGYKIKSFQGEKTRKNFTIKKYEGLTFLQCTWNEPITPLTQICFEIKAYQQKIGEILLQYYPDGAEDLYKGAKNPTLRLRNITLNEEYRNKGHGSRSLETLFTVLRLNKLPDLTDIYLETNIDPNYLMKLWNKFGFTIVESSSWYDVKILKCPLKKVKFPYYKK